jgi:hypothetical protein
MALLLGGIDLKQTQRRRWHRMEPEQNKSATKEQESVCS